MEKEVAKKFFDGSVFYDAETGFTLDVSGFTHMDSMDSLEKEYAARVEEAVAFVGRMERGEVVNHTEVKAESEDRAVDHYNLRLKEELVPGKSLAESVRLWEDIKSSVDTVQGGETPMFTDVIFNGIGGSFLGPLMLVVAMLGQDYNMCYPKTLRQRIHFMANTDADSFANVFSHVDLKTTLMVHMSKSGSTAETKGNLEAFNDLLVKNAIESPGKHNMAITVEGSYLDGFALEKGFLNVFPMNVETGGRTSVCSAIGMVPAAFAQIDFAEFLRGQSHMDEMTRKHTLRENPAMLIASLVDRMTKDLGKKNMIILGYSDAIKEFSHYLQQLYMESLGKEYSWDGVAHAEGQTVFGGVGTGEQHAFMQQVQKGIADCYVRFVYFRKRKHDFANGKAGSMGRQMLSFVVCDAFSFPISYLLYRISSSSSSTHSFSSFLSLNAARNAIGTHIQW
jgi:glucose-6-phosphate isomerase